MHGSKSVEIAKLSMYLWTLFFFIIYNYKKYILLI